MKRFEMIVVEIEKNITEVSIVDTEEYNVELLVINCENDDLFFLKETVETVLRELNWQDTYIKKLEEENKKLKETVDEQDRRIEGLEHQVFCEYDLY